MCWEADAWPGEAALTSTLPTPLTALGSGEPSFAAYVPNTMHVFSFHDPLDDVSSGTVAYAICGWHGGRSSAPLDADSPWSADTWGARMADLRWSVGDDLDSATTAAAEWATAHGHTADPNALLPRRTVYHGLVAASRGPLTTTAFIAASRS